MKTKLLNHIFKIKDFAVFLMFFIAAAFPLGKMDGVEVESAYNVIFKFIKGLFSKNVDSNLAVFFIYSLYYLVLGAGHITYLKCYRTAKLSKIITRFVCIVIMFISLIITASINLKFYGLTSSTLTIVIIAFVINIVFMTAELFLSRRQPKEEVTDGEKEIQTDVNEFENTKQSKEQDESPEKVTVKKRYKWTYSGLVISTVAFVFLCFYFIPSKINNRFYYYGHNYENVTNYSLGESFLGMDVDAQDYINNFKEGRINFLNYQSSNYLYWQNKIDEKKEQIIKLIPETSSEKDLEKYAEELKILQNDIKTINNKLNSLNYENISITTVSRSETRVEDIGNGTHTTVNYYADIIEIVYDTQYNSGSSSVIKWNNKKNRRLFCGQSIELTQTEFNEYTDFQSAKIGATINYYDGSLKKSYITVSNYGDLNNASKGKHTLKWSDDWGSYEYEITII